jgi:hypothetical protein
MQITPSLNHYHCPNGNISMSRRRRGRSLVKLVLGAVLAIGSTGLTASAARAVVVTIGGQQWDVTTFTGSYNDNISKFETPTNGGVMPWWGQVTEAALWADALGWSLGDLNTGLWDLPQNLRAGPGLAWSIGLHPVSADEIVYSQYVYSQPASSFPAYQVSPANMGDLRSRAAITWVQATQPVPGPLPIFGAAAALGASRQLRRRVKGCKNVNSIGKPV